MAAKKPVEEAPEAPVEDSVEAVADDAVVEDAPVADETEAVAEEAPEVTEDEAVAEVQDLLDAESTPEEYEAAVAETLAEVAAQRRETFEGWTAQDPAGLPTQPEPPLLNGIAEHELPVAEEFAKNGGNDGALALVNKI